MLDAIGDAPVLFIPGWGGSGPDHWQTLWQHALGATRVELADWFCVRCEVWIAALDAALTSLEIRDPRPPVLVAHSLGCIAVGHWARRTRRSVRAALLVAPADVERAPSLARLRAFAPVPREPLPFSSIVVASDDDPYVAADRAESFSTWWGSQFQLIVGGGHLNAASGLGHWPFGQKLMFRMLEGRQRT